MNQETHHHFLPTYQGCIVCGQKAVNPASMNLRFQTDNEYVFTDFMASSIYEGYKGIVHGGIISALLDEAIGWAVNIANKHFVMTGELTVRYLKPVPIGKTVTVRGWFVEEFRRYSAAEGDIKDRDGVLYARAKGKFFHLEPDASREVTQYLTFQPGDLDIST